MTCILKCLILYVYTCHNQHSEHTSFTLKTFLMFFCIPFLSPAPTPNQVSIDLLSVTITLGNVINEMMQYIFFLIWLLSLKIVILRCIRIVSCIKSSLGLLSNVPLNVCTTTYLWMCCWIWGY